MAVELTGTSANFLGTGVSSVYAPEFYARTADQVHVYVNGVLQTLGDDYTITGLADADGVDITATFPLNAAVYVERLTAITQEVDTQNNETILEDVLDAEFDKLTMIDQEQQTQVDRALKVPKGEIGADVPSISERAGKFLAFDAEGQGYGALGTGADLNLRADLANPAAGGALVSFKRSAASSGVAASVNKVLAEHVTVTSWGVQGTNVTTDRAKIQAALDEAPLGSTLYFPPGQYALDQGIVQTRALNLKFARGASVFGKTADATKNLWDFTISQSADGAGDVRLMKVEDMEIGLLPGFAAKHTIHIANLAPMASNLGMDFFGGSFAALDAQAGVGVHIEGLVTQLHKFWGSQIVNGAYLDQCSDAVRFMACTMLGKKVGFRCNLQVGAWRTALWKCVITCEDGAVLHEGGSRVDYIDNQTEQLGANGSALNAMWVLSGGYKSRGNRLIGNNFGGGNVGRNLYLDADLHATYIDGCDFGSTAGGVDILIANPNVKWTRIGPSNTTRGNRGGVVETPPGSGNFPANFNDIGDMLVVLDGGTGTYGVRRLAIPTFAGSVPGIGLSNGWTSATNFMFFKDFDDRMNFRGRLNPGTFAAGTLIATMPEGFRPDDLTFLLVPLSTGQVGIISVDYDGKMKIVSMPASAAIDFASVTYLAKREGYDPGY